MRKIFGQLFCLGGCLLILVVPALAQDDYTADPIGPRPFIPPPQDDKPDSGAPLGDEPAGYVDVEGPMPGILGDGVAAQVNDKVITISELNSLIFMEVERLRRSFSGDEFRKRVEEAQQDALEQMIEKRLIIENFKEQEFEMPNEYVESEVAKEVVRLFGGDRMAFLKALRNDGMTYNDFREKVEERLIVQVMRSRIVREVNIPPGDVIRYYEEHKEDFKQAPRVKLWLILIEGEEDSPERPEAKQRAEEIVAQLDAGESFQALAREYSSGAFREKGGDWDWVEKGTLLRSDLEEVAFSLEPGEHSDVIPTESGFYVLQVEDRKDAGYLPLSEVRLQIQKRLEDAEKTKRYREWIEKLRNQAYVRVYN
jgi:peptidyl-prolyl cis-trans isomerase SurA